MPPNRESLMAKSNRRRKQDKAKAAAKSAEQVRLRKRTELLRVEAEQIVRLADRATPPAEVAEIVAARAGDSAMASGPARFRRPWRAGAAKRPSGR